MIEADAAKCTVKVSGIAAALGRPLALTFVRPVITWPTADRYRCQNSLPERSWLSWVWIIEQAAASEAHRRVELSSNTAAVHLADGFSSGGESTSTGLDTSE